MKITQNVIMDLLPLYQSGEASEDSVALINAYLEDHPGLASKIESISEILTQSETFNYPNKVEEMQTLHKTRNLLRWRSTLMGLAIFFSLAPLSFYVTPETGLHFLFAGKPFSLAIYLAFAVASWVGFSILHRRTRSTLL